MTTILILAANPRGTTELRLGEEVRRIQEGLRLSQHRDRFTIASEWAVQIQDVRRSILKYRPQIVHFSGHGVADGELVFENEIGQIQFVRPEALAGLFKLFSDHVQCVLLNACYSEIQANAIVENINFVIGMGEPIGDRAAIEFATGFYDALGAGHPVEKAYDFGCNAIQMAGIAESLTPRLKRKGSMLQDNNVSFVCNQNFSTELNTPSSTPTLPRIKYEFVLSGNVDEIEKQKFEAMVAHLKIISRDISLTLLRVESGSIKLILEGSEEGFQLLESLVASGELDQVLGFSVQGINRSDPASSTYKSFFSIADQTEEEIRSQIKRQKGENVLNAESVDSNINVSTIPDVSPKGKTLDLHAYGNYPGIDLQGANLKDIDLQGCNLSGANLSGANLSGADLRRVNLNSANLRHSDLSRAHLTGAELVNTNLSHANLHCADLQRANLERANLNQACLIEAQLLCTRLRRAKLNNAQLICARLDGAGLRGADLSHADLQEVSLSRANLSFATLHSANLERAWLLGACMRGANLSSAQLTDADLSGAFLVAANLRDANLQNAKLFRANLSDALLEGCNLDDAKLSRAYLSGANLKNATLNRAEMTEVILLRACLEGAELCQSLLNRAYLNEADLSKANLNDANLSSANLTRVNLQDAPVIAARFEGSLGIDERLRDDLRHRGAIVMLIRYPDSTMLGQADLETLCQVSEAKDNIVRRFDDLKETLQAFQKIIGYVKAAVQDHSCLATSDLSKFDQECEGFRESINAAQENTFAHLETVHNGDLQQWLIDQYPQELDTIHDNIHRLSQLTYVFHELWISLLDRIDDKGYRFELSDD